MKLFVVILILVSAYVFTMLKTTDTVLGQVQHINQTYQYVANHGDQLANSQK